VLTRVRSTSPAERGLGRWHRSGEEGRRRSGWWRVTALAASVAVIVSGTVTAWRGGWLSPAQPFREFVSAPASRVTVTLADGTRLVLGPATRLRVPRGFGATGRLVELDGQALFTVVHDARHPFAVRTARATVQDVGTTFAIRAYAGDREEHVAVTEGEVALSGAALHARDVAAIDTTGRIRISRETDLTPFLAWMQGAFVFKDTPLGEVARELGRTYDVPVTIGDSALSEVRITASFGRLSLDEVVGAVALAAEAHVERHGRTIVFVRGAVPAGRRASPENGGIRMTRAKGAMR
jgi:ferric-dicitrate binding protein FerR (iron transport regulator)